MPVKDELYAAPKELGIFKEIGSHAFEGVNSEEIVQRIVNSRESYEERQRMKGIKAVAESEMEKKGQIGNEDQDT